MSAVRLFVALELPAEWRSALGQLQRRHERTAPGYFRWVDPALLHLTVVFLGDQPAPSIDALAELIRHAASRVAIFSLALGHTGTFGPPNSPRVLWVEAIPSGGQLQRLRRALEQELRAAEFSFQARPLVPHITLARARSHASGTPRQLRIEPPPLRFTVREVVLMESRLGPTGPSYEARARATLSARTPTN